MSNEEVIPGLLVSRDVPSGPQRVVADVDEAAAGKQQLAEILGRIDAGNERLGWNRYAYIPAADRVEGDVVDTDAGRVLCTPPQAA